MAGNAGGIRAGRAYVELGTQDSKLAAGLKAAEVRLKAFGAGVSKIGLGMAGLGAAIIAPFGVAAKMFADAGSELADMSARTGLSVEALGQLGHAAGQTGTDLATVEGAGRKMQKALAEAAGGSSEAATAFGVLGLNFQKLIRLSPDEQFQAVAKAIGKVENPAIKAGAAMAIFGKSGTALLPMIDDFDALTKEARDLGLVMSSEDASAADALGDAMDNVTAMLGRSVTLIGGAVAPMLTELAESMTRVIKYALDWVNANRPLVATIFKVGAGLVVAGGAFAALGVTISGVGVVLGGIVTGLGAVGTVVGAIVSPVGLVIGAVAGMTAAFLTMTDAGGQVLAWLGERFGALEATATAAFKGISDALAAGDIALAGQILWTSLKIEWIKGVNFLKGVWADWGIATIDVFANVGTQINSIALDVWAGLRVAWAQGTADLMGSWGSMLSRMLKSLIPLSDAIFQVMGVDLSKAIDESLKQGGFDPGGDGGTALAGQLGNIETERDMAQQDLAGKAEADRAARRKAADDRVANGTAELEQALADLQAMFGQAAKEKVAADDGDLAKKKFALDPAGLDMAIRGAEKSVDVAGSFNAMAFRGLGLGSSVADRQVEEQKKSNQLLTGINDKVRRIGPLVADEP